MTIFDADTPKTRVPEDSFDRKQVAEVIADLLRGKGDDQAIIAGIFGKWGSGKSTAIEFVKSMLLKHDYVAIIEINPWLLRSEHDVVAETFASMIEVLRGTGGLKKKGLQALKRYGAALGRSSSMSIGAFGVGIALNAQQFAKEIGGRENARLTTLKATVIAELRRIKRKLVIIVDDLDRMQPAEINATLRLFRAGLDLPNVAFLVGADPTILESALGTPSTNNSTPGALEKLVQVAFHLPQLGSDQLADYTSAALRQLSAEIRQYGVDIPPAIWDEMIDDAREHLTPIWVTPRQVVRVRNALVLPLALLWKETSPPDLMLLTALQLQFPQLYEELWASRDTLCAISGAPSRTWIRKEEFQNERVSLLERLLARVPHHKGEVKALLLRLFPSLGDATYTDRWSIKRRVCAHDYIDVYFRANVGKSGISDALVDEIIVQAGTADTQKTSASLLDLVEPTRWHSLMHALSVRRTDLSPSAKCGLARRLSASLQRLSFENTNNTDLSRETLRTIYAVLSSPSPSEDDRRCAESIVGDRSLPLIVRCNLLNWLGQDLGENANDTPIRDAAQSRLGSSLADEIREQLADHAWTNTVPMRHWHTYLRTWARYRGKAQTAEFLTTELREGRLSLPDLLNPLVANWVSGNTGTTRREFGRDSLENLSFIVNPLDLEPFVPKSAKDSKEDIDQRSRGLQNNHELLVVFAACLRMLKQPQTAAVKRTSIGK